MGKIAFILLLLHSLNYGVDTSDPYKGQVYYKFFIAPKLGIDGAKFAKLHTKEEWSKIYQDNGENFYKKFDIQIYSFDNTVLQHIEAFSIYYAKDSDAVPNCAE